MKNCNISNFTIYAERHCGTNFLEKIITTEYGLSANWNFGWKHFFGFHNKEIMQSGQKTLFICISRNIFQWSYAMFKLPHHMKKETNFISFLNNPVYSYQVDGHGNLTDKEIVYEKNIFNFTRYQNIIDMRTTKYTYLVDCLPNIVQNYLLVQYEDICNNIDKIQYELSEKFALHPKNKLSNNFNKTDCSLDITSINQIRNKMDSKLEKKLGYFYDFIA